jgi:hypothetical protein
VALRNRRLAELGLFVGLTLLHTWPLASDPARLSRLDNNDTAFNTWVIAWVQHTLPRDPLHLFEAPVFYPEQHTLAYSEHMIVPAIIGLPLNWAGASPVLVFNLLVMFGFVLSGVAMSRLMTRWTGSLAAGVVAGALFAFNAHVLTRIPHLQALHMEFVPLVWYAMDRLLTEPRRRNALLLAGAFVVQALCSNYMMVMLAVALAAALMVRPEPWTDARRVWPHLVLAGSVGVLALLPFLLPYYRLHETQGLTRTIDDVRRYSAWWQDYLSTVGRLHYEWWAYKFSTNRTALFPGFTAVLLSLVAIGAGVAWRDRRARMMVPVAIVGVVLSLGANLALYGWLQEHIAPFQGMRAAARWGHLALLAVAVLAGFGVATLQKRWGERRWWPALVTILLGAVTVEAMRTPLLLVPFQGIPSVHGRMARDEVHAIVLYPLYPGGAFHANARYMLYQTRHWKPIVNGYSSFAPQSFFERANRFNRFPAPEVIAEMRQIGVSHVMLEHATPESVFGRQAFVELRSHSDLEFVLDQDGWAVYRIR